MARSGLTSKHRDLWLAGLVYAAVSVIYAACAPPSLWLAHTPYNHFAWLADAMLHGRLSLEGLPPAYAGGNDFAQFEHRWFVVFPPFPALLLLPLVAVCKHVDSVRDGIFFLLVAGLAPVGIFIVIQRLRQARLSMLSEKGALFLSGLFALATVHFFISVQGTVWFAAHVVATAAIAFFAAASIEAKYPFLAGLALSAALATRSHLAFSGIFFVFEAFRSNQKPRTGLWNYHSTRISRQLALFAAPCIVTALCLLCYNWARFHDPFEVGYRYLQIAWQPRITRWGMFSYHYLARNLGIDNTAAKNYITRYFERYPGVKAYMETTRELARKQGYVETVFGRRLQLPGIKSAKGAQLAGLERAAINAPMQGTAADLIKLSMVKVQQVLDAEQRATKMIMQVHDELVFEVPEQEVAWVNTEIPRLMAGVADLKVALLAEVGVGPNWDQAH